MVLFSVPEDTIIQIVKSSSQDATQPNMYEVEITPEKRTYPKAYDFCQQILEQKCLEDPFICGKLLISNYDSNFVPIQAVLAV